MRQWATIHAPCIQIHALTVDHGLRPESKTEAKQVAAWVNGLSSRTSPLIQRGDVRDDIFLTHKILTWVGKKPTTKIAETAREKRYELMADYCHAHKISHLFLAHHADDQAETVLMRLAAGSGVDGLAGMENISKYRECHPGRDPAQAGGDPGPSSVLTAEGPGSSPLFPRGDVRDDTLYLCRPLLSATHRQLLDTLRHAGQDWIEDPSNKNPKSARVRVRTARDVLAAEGLTADRMGKLAIRAGRARDVLQAVADRAWMDEVQVVRAPLKSVVTVTILCDDFDTWFTDTQIRVMGRAIETVSGCAPRMEQVEDVIAALSHTSEVVGAQKTIRRTLAGCIITRGAKWVKITPET